MQDLVIFGSEFREVVKLIEAINRAEPLWRLRGFIDDRAGYPGQDVLGYPILGDRSLLPSLTAEGVVWFNNVTGVVANARAVSELLAATGRPLVSLVHPAVDLGHVQLGEGSILPEGCVVGSGSCIGRQLAARLHAVISHDVAIEDFVFIGPGAVLGSGVQVETGAFIGAGATVMSGCRIGAHSVIGAGALVAEDVPAGVTLAGVRGRVVRSEGRA